MHGNIANRHWQWRFADHLPRGKENASGDGDFYDICKSPLLLASPCTGEQTASQTGGFAFAALGSSFFEVPAFAGVRFFR